MLKFYKPPFTKFLSYLDVMRGDLVANPSAAAMQKYPYSVFLISDYFDEVIARLKFLNNSQQIGYVYLLGYNGGVVANYTIKGKVSSLNSYLTTTEQLRCADPQAGNDMGCVTTSSPDLDGSYGNNPSGIFFFTTSGAYVEWSGSYMYSSQPLNIQTPVSLTEQVK